jgi:type IV secretion system protein VirB10
MNDQDPQSAGRERPGSAAAAGADTISPLPGELGIPNVAERQRGAMSRKGLLAVGLLVLSLILAAAFTIQRFAASSRKTDDTSRASDRPAAATSDPRRLDLLLPAAASAPIAQPTRIPPLMPMEADVEPIGVRRTGTSGTQAGAPGAQSPLDAPVLIVTSRPAQRGQATGASRTQGTAVEEQGPQGTDDRHTPEAGGSIDATARNLQGYQRQLQGLLDSLTKTAARATGQEAGATQDQPMASLLGGPPMAGTTPGGGPTAAGNLFGGLLQGSSTPTVVATNLGNRSLTLPRGTAFTCALKTKVISATSGLVGCQVQRNVFSDDGRVLLIERGSHLDGEYRIASVRPGTVRIPVLWTRIRTPLGVTVYIDSPGTGQLGESGIDGYVDNRWGERIGAAMLLSLIDDSVKLVIQTQASSSNSDRQADTILLPSTTANTSKLA